MNKIFRNGCIPLLVFGLTFQVSADERKLVDIDDYFTQALLSTCDLSPDGKHVVYTERRWEPPREFRNTNLWLVDVASRHVRRLTFHSGNDNSPQWSPDSRFVYFLSSRTQGDGGEPPYNGKTQVWRVDIATDRILPITRLKSGVQSFELSTDGLSLYYKVGGEQKEDQWKSLRDEHDSLEYGRGTTKVSELWRLDLQTWRAEKLVAEKRYIREFSVSPDDRLISMVTVKDELLISHEGWSRVDIYDSSTKEVSVVPDDVWRKNVPSPHGWIEGLAWCPDSERLAFLVSFDGYPRRLICAEASDGNFKAWRLNGAKNVSAEAGRLQWHGRSLCFIGQWRARQRVYQISDVRAERQGEITTLTEGDVAIFGFSISNDGERLAVIKSDMSSGRDLYLVNAGSPSIYDSLTVINPQMKNWKMPQISIVNWLGADGDRVEGILELPPDYVKSDGKLPMVVVIHGGPTSADLIGYRFWFYGRTLLPSKGFAVLCPNYRGSTGFGDNFMTELVGRENDIEVIDILAGVDAMVTKGIADPDRLGVMGWSNGGFLTNALIARTNRFKAASSGAGVIDQTMEWGLEDTPGHVINFMNGNQPWDNPNEYRNGSPLYGLGKATTPTLIHVGEDDERVPAAHSRTLFRALNRYRNVPTQLVVYPGSGHTIQKYAFRKAKMEWDVAWFERYILGKEE